MKKTVYCLGMFLVFSLISCNRNERLEFASCDEYGLKSFSHPAAVISFSFPDSWQTGIDQVNGDSILVSSADTSSVATKSIGFIQFPSVNGYRKNPGVMLRSLNKRTATLIFERGILRIDGVALDYVIGNDELFSTIMVPYEEKDQVILILGRIDRKDAPDKNDFCFMGPVLKEFIRNHSEPRT